MLEIIFLSLVQSITEFLPVSSSGHLVIVRELFGWREGGLGLLTDLGLHVGTLGAVCVYFMRELWFVFKGLYKKGAPRYQLTCLVIASIPICVLGLLLGEKTETFLRHIPVISVMLIVFGILLYVGDKWGKRTKTMNTMSYSDAFLIGCAQCLSLIPGVSRSGITITAARLRGIERTSATHFSMILSVPSILGASGYYFLKSILNNDFSYIPTQFYWGIIFSFFGGLLAIAFLMNWVKNRSFFPFAIYRVVLGFLLILFYVF